MVKCFNFAFPCSKLLMLIFQHAIIIDLRVFKDKKLKDQPWQFTELVKAGYLFQGEHFRFIAFPKRFKKAELGLGMNP